MMKVAHGVVLLLALIGLYSVGSVVSGFLPGGKEAPAASVQEARLESGEAWAAMLDELRRVGPIPDT